MNRSEVLDRNIISDLIVKLSELDHRLSDSGSSGASNSFFRKSFLFSFEMNGAATAEEYSKYFDFLNNIGEILRGLGIHIGNNGYAYIIDSVKIILDRGTYDLRLKSDVYALIASKYHIRNQSTIEHSIRNAISTAYEDHVRSPGINNMTAFTKRPTNKQFLIYVAESVQKSMCESMMRTAG